MSAGWVAGSVRARALARRRLGSTGARRIAAGGSLHAALAALARTPYGARVQPGHSVAQAQYSIACTLLWHLRVLAGWLPRDGVAMLRTLAGWFEIANTDELLLRLTDGDAGPMFELGALATAWPRLAGAGSLTELRAALAASAWQDPLGEDPRTIQLGMRASWANRVAALPAPAPSWAAAAAALLLAGERYAAGSDLTAFARKQVFALLGRAPLQAGGIDEMTGSLPARAGWLLPPGTRPDELWQAQPRWWARVERDAFALVTTSKYRAEPVLGAAALLAVDAWRVRAALELAARGGHPLDAYDAVAYDVVPRDVRGPG